MRFNIAYTDYKKQRLYNHYITHKFKKEVKSCDYKYTINTANIKRSFEIDYNMIEYTDDKGDINYRFELSPQHLHKKTCRLDRMIDKICSVFFIYANKMDVIQIDDKVNIGIDENKLSMFDDTAVPDLNITMNIYDMLSVTNMIRQHTSSL